MPPCWGLVCLTSLSRCLSRSSALGLPLGLGVRGCLCLTPGLTHVCISLSPHRRMSSASLLALSLALSSCPQICLSGWGWGSWFAHLCFRRSLSVSPTPGSLLLMGGGGGSGGLGPLSASSSLSPSYLTPGSPSPIRLSHVSGFQNLSASLPPLLSHFAPSPYFQNPLPQLRLAPGPWGTRLPLLLGGGKEEGRPPHLAPALPPPSPPAPLYKANQPLYSAAPRAGLPRPPYMARRLLTALGPALGEGGARRLDPSPARALAPHLPPPPAPRIPPTRVPNPSSSLPACGTVGPSLSVPFC